MATTAGPENQIALMRRRPEMWVGNIAGGDAVLNMVLEVVANACDQHFAGRCSMIDVQVAADGTITLLDENRAPFTLQALTTANDAEDVRVEPTKLEEYDIESSGRV